MKKVVKNGIEWTIITIALCILVVVLAAATKGMATNSNTHSFYSPSLGTSILVNDDVFNDIRNEEIELRALELLSSFLDKYFS